MESNIRKLRRDRKLSQTELARVIGRTQQTVSHMERDRDRMSINDLVALSGYFGVSTDCILGIKEIEDELPKEENRAAEDNTAGNRKILYQLILLLLLDSIDGGAGTGPKTAGENGDGSTDSKIIKMP